MNHPLEWIEWVQIAERVGGPMLITGYLLFSVQQRIERLERSVQQLELSVTNCQEKKKSPLKRSAGDEDAV
jgi:hypothetical protein